MIRNNCLTLSSLVLLMTLSINSFAAHDSRVVVAPQCLLDQIDKPYTVLSTKDNMTLIQLDRASLDALTTAKHQQKKPCGGYIDVTKEWKTSTKPTLKSAQRATAFLLNYLPKEPLKLAQPTDYRIQYSDQVQQAIAQINPDGLWQDFAALTSFYNRYADSDYGVEAVNWMKKELEKITADRSDVSIYLVPTEDFMQPSLVMKLGSSNEPGIVIGGHIDTTSDNKPGADDDGSGSVSVLQTVRSLLASHLTFKKPIYFIWYAAEEEGLIGSEEVVNKFKNDGIVVTEVLQLDMTGYAYRNAPTMWLINDYVDKNLTNYLEKLIQTYVKQPVKRTACGYACSDHASWHLHGFKSSMPAEAAFEHTNPVLHTARDTMDKLSRDHMLDYIKLSIAFAVELAEPVTENKA